jgi:hypothetical protein
MSNLVVNSKATAFRDATPNNNPQRKHFDWNRGLTASVSNAKVSQETIPAGGSVTFWNGTVSTSVDGTSAFSVTRNVADPSRYRFTSVSGTAPVFRTDRALAFATHNVTITVNPDATATFDVAGSTWGAVAAGDTVFIPGASTGDAAGPFNVLNEGFWVVLAVLSATSIQCQRPTGTDFQGSPETIAVVANSNISAFSASGVQIGNHVEISGGFTTATQRTYTVDRVTPTWFEVISSSPIAIESSKIPTATGLKFYAYTKRFLRLEANQEVVVRLNGATDDTNRVSPIEAGAEEAVGWFEKWGPVWSLVVINKSSQSVTVDAFSAE